MKSQRIVALLLVAVMVLTTVAFAETAPTADQELQNITAKVKEILDLDTEQYTQFSGYLTEEMPGHARWDLDWSGDGISLSITAGENGKIYSYYVSESVSDSTSYYVGSGLTIPSLPEDKVLAAYQAAVEFAGKAVALDGESATLENDITPSLTATTYRFRGEIQVNGLSTPIGCSVTVRASDLKILRFRRDDTYSEYAGTPNTASTKITEDAARRMLRSTLELEAQYVLDDNSTTAHVMYVPVAGDDYYVDGVTGELVNLTELQNAMWLKNSNLFYGMAEDSAAGETGSSLSKAELEGAAKLAGAKSKEDLDRLIQNTWPEIGLTNYSLSSFSYAVGKTDEETGETPVTASMTYSRQVGEEMIYKYLRLDAKSGKLESLYTHRGSMKNSESTVKYSYNVALTAAQSTAETVLSAFAGKNYASLGLANTEEGRVNNTWEHVFRFEQEQDGYFYHDNCYVVGIDTADGTLTQLSGAFDEAVKLISPTHSIVSLSTAQNAYEGALTAKYSYLEVPVSVTQGEYYSKELKELGYEYLPALRSGWHLTATEGKNPRMVDALTGQVIYYPADDTSDEGISYSDLEGHWVKTAAEALGRYGVGLYTENLVPEKALTQLELVALLSSVEGYRFDLEEVNTDAEEQNELYNAGYRLGLVTPETRQPEKIITRGELVKVLLDAAGYQEIAALSGIFQTQFADQDQIPAGELGYAALAQGLGLVNGGSGKLYAGERTATRSEAMAMLYQYMNR